MEKKQKMQVLAILATWVEWLCDRTRVICIKCKKSWRSNTKAAKKLFDISRDDIEQRRDGTGQDFLDPTRPVIFKIIAGWPAGRPVFDRPGQPVFCRRVCSLFNVFNKKSSKWGAWVRCKNLWLWTEVSEKKRKSIFAFFAKITQFWDLFGINFCLNDLFWAAQNVQKISIKRTGGHLQNYWTFFSNDIMRKAKK